MGFLLHLRCETLNVNIMINEFENEIENIVKSLYSKFKPAPKHRSVIDGIDIIERQKILVPEFTELFKETLSKQTIIMTDDYVNQVYEQNLLKLLQITRQK